MARFDRQFKREQMRKRGVFQMRSQARRVRQRNRFAR